MSVYTWLVDIADKIGITIQGSFSLFGLTFYSEDLVTLLCVVILGYSLLSILLTCCKIFK